jgi:eukaryotic-like serine/threonine-protein kinase
MIGQTIASYRIEALLGEGGMGSVYRAIDTNLTRPVALKLMHPHMARQPEFRQRFIQEARSAANLSHPSIVRIYQFEAQGDLMFIAMEYFPGGTLTGHLKRAASQKQSIDLRETLALLAQIADALDYAHRRGIVHRDIKPDNILLATLEQPERPGEPPLRAVVTDFGLARLRTAGAVQTQDGTFMGTLPYMSPEQCLGKDLDGRSDIYALGVMLYQMTTNRLPFEVTTPTDALMKHINEPPPPPRQFSPNLPEIIGSIILKCLAKDPAQRFATASDLAAALRSASVSLTEDQVTTFAPPASAIHLNTELMQAQPEQRGSSVFGQAGPVAPARLDRLQVTTSDGATGRLVPINAPSIIIGRDRECDIVLDDNRASRKHARIDFDGDSYSVTDLNSTNGTFLSGARLLPGVPEDWPVEKVLQVGECFLRIVPSTQVSLDLPGLRNTGPLGPAGGSGAASSGGTAPLPTGTAAYVATPADSMVAARVSMNLGQSEVSVEAGQPVSVVISLFNQGTIVDHFRLQVEGIPASWIPAVAPLVQLMPGAQQQLTLTIQPPRSPQARAGSYPVNLRAVSQDNPNQLVSARLTLVVRPYFQFATEIFPQRVRANRPARLTVKNIGNAAQNYQVDWTDRGDELVFEPNVVQLPVSEGQSAVVEFRAKPKQSAFIGGEKSYNFTTRITSPQGDTQTQSGELVSRALVPTWLIPILATLCLCLGLLGGGALASSAGILPFMRSATPPASTAVVVETTDSDGDGLSDVDELRIGTDPRMADTDQDGISDFDEVQQGSDPLTPAQGATATPALTGDATPTPAPTEPPAPGDPLVVKMVQPNTNDYQPAVDNLVFQVIAYDPQVGTVDGDGIQSVKFEFFDAGGNLVFQSSESNPGYCAFQGGEPDCNVLNFLSQYKRWPNGASITNGGYTMTATAYAPDQRSQRIEYSFSIEMLPPRMAYTSDRNGNTEIFVQNLETGSETNLSNDTSAGDSNPAWSPDGRYIAFQTFREGNNEVYVMDADGRNMRNISRNSFSNETDPAWSADGLWIAYTSDRNSTSDIFITSVNDGSTFQVTYDFESDYQPAFSPDGRSMAFVSTRTNGMPGIYVMAFDPGTAKQGLEGDVSEFYVSSEAAYNPDWSPDGSFLAFASGGVSDANIYIMEFGGSPIAIATSPFYEYEPTWFLDDSQVVYTQTESFGALYVVNRNGSNPRLLITGTGYGNFAADVIP